MEKFVIKNIYGETIAEQEAETLTGAIELIVKSRAYLSRANLSRANLSHANLSGANLSRAYLSRANLSGAYLSDANLSGANLSDANLSDAYLSDANLSDANLSHAYLSGANLSGANLSRANLSHAYLSDANLSGANLSHANLSGANLSRAYLSRANLSRAKLPHFQICPQEGAFVAVKRVFIDRAGTGTRIIRVEIPADAKRTSSLVGRKCRAEKVLSHGNGFSMNIDYPQIEYRDGEIVYADKYDDDIRVECTGGIHFFITEKEAEEFTL